VFERAYGGRESGIGKRWCRHRVISRRGDYLG
jgi:hypothetical protein